jgi:uncharacterized membrane protein HdeD (DUF308 family)
MIGSSPKMPKRARYPLFLLGLAVIILGGLALFWSGASVGAIVVSEVMGSALLVSSVVFK